MRGRIKILRKYAIGGCRPILTVGVAFYRGTVRLNGPKNVREQLRGSGSHHNACPRRFVACFSNRDLFEIEGPSCHEDGIQHLRQDERIDDVSAEHDGFLGSHRHTPLF